MAEKPAPVPLCDIQAQYAALKPEIDEALLRVLASGMAINGPDVAALESETAAYCGVRHAIGCGSGTDALLLALHALDLGAGDEVILPPFTFFATLGSIVRCGASPVFVDIDPETYNLDPARLEQAITPRTRAIMPVHLFGQCADMDPIRAIASKHGLTVIEDAAQSFGAEYRGVRCGALAELSCFSFYPSKNLGTFGDAGMVTTNDSQLAKRLLALRNHGSEVKYFHKYMGWNGRIDTLQAAMLRVKLPLVDGWIQGRQAAAKRYDALIEESGLQTTLQRPVVRNYGLHSFNQYVVRAEGMRDALVQHLKSQSIGCEIYYPLALHLQECIRHLGYRPGDFPISEAATRDVLALPMFPELKLEQQRRVIDVCAAFVHGQKRQAA